MDDLLREFQSLLNQSSGKGLAGSIDILLTQMDIEAAQYLKLCAIPHQFDPTVIQALVPELNEAHSKSFYNEFENLSITLSLKKESAFHDEARLHLFNQWLMPDKKQEFREASQNLVEYYEKRAAGVEGIEQENMKRNRMFHLLGVNQHHGFGEFKQLFQEMWHQYRLSECKTLINLVHEYDKVLEETNQLWLIYYEGMLASDLRQWPRTESLFHRILNYSELPVELNIKTLNRLGIAFAKQRKNQAAIEKFQKALELAQSSPENVELIDNIMHDLGSVYRDSGELKKAEKFLTMGLELATKENDLATMALIYNGFGRLQRKLGNSHEAIRMFQESLHCLNENKDLFRPAQVYNNLGMTFADIREWEKSKEVLQNSLEIKRKAGDTRGQAMALSNLVRVYRNLDKPDEAVKVSLQAVGLFEQMKDKYHVALVKRNLGKLYRSMNNYDLAKQYLKEAIELFEQSKETREVQATQIDFSSVTKQQKKAEKRGVPWWIWLILIVIIVLLVLLFTG